MSNPIQRLVAKDKDSGEYISLGTVWEDDQGRRNLGLQCRMLIDGEWTNLPVRVIVEMPDGDVEVTNGTHFIDFKDNQRKSAAQDPPRNRAAARRTQARQVPVDGAF